MILLFFKLRPPTKALSCDVIIFVNEILKLGIGANTHTLGLKPTHTKNLEST